MGCRGATAPLFGAFTSLRVPVNAPQATTTVLEGADQAPTPAVGRQNAGESSQQSGGELSTDQRPGESQAWLNALVQREF